MSLLSINLQQKFQIDTSEIQTHKTNALWSGCYFFNPDSPDKCCFCTWCESVSLIPGGKSAGRRSSCRLGKKNRSVFLCELIISERFEADLMWILTRWKRRMKNTDTCPAPTNIPSNQRPVEFYAENITFGRQQLYLHQ